MIESPTSSMATRVIHVETDDQIAAAAAEGAAALKAGQLVAFATETVYGIAAAANLPETMERLRELKSRPSRPFSLHIGRPCEVERYIRDIPAGARRLMARAWPGPLTLLLATGGRLADDALQSAGLHDVLVAEGLLGIRCPQGELCETMLAAAGVPIVAPSANLAGRPSPRDARGVLEQLDGKIDLLIDTGPTRYGRDSTIVQFTADGWQVLREGVLEERSIRRLLRRRILFVCTGNTCRSPMAAGLARKIIAEQLGVAPEKLAEQNIEIISAGVWAVDGQLATPEAVAAAGEHGADISGHRSQKLTIELINGADLIFCMSDYHVDEVRRLSGTQAVNVRRLDEQADIPDPIGCGGEVYRHTAERIEIALRASLAKGLP